jgi:biotin-dependent carboxylase-like uncharacterized protein
MSLEVFDPGLATRVADLGRLDSRGLGVPTGGAADRAAMILGNALVGNPPEAAALEICINGPRLRATTDVACAVYGAPFEVNGPDVVLGKTFTLAAGDALHIGGTPQGMRAYLCVRGGLQTPTILGSRSALDVVRRGDTVACNPGRIHRRYLRNILPDFTDSYTLRVLPGLQADWFTEPEFYSQEFTLSTASNRIGLRLEGTPLTMPQRELVSEAVAPGAVQVTRDGQCIVLGVDGQTIGGYPKIAQVVQADLDRLGQLRPGNRVRFVRITPEEAVTLYRRQAGLLRHWVMRLTA